MSLQSINQIRHEAQTSRRLWVKVLGMLEQNWCLIEQGPSDAVDLVFFDDHGDVFDWISLPNLLSAQHALHFNGFEWMWLRPSFYRVSGMPRLPPSGARNRDRPVYSSGEYWLRSDEDELDTRLPGLGIPTRSAKDDLDRFVQAQDLFWYAAIEEIAQAHKETHWMWFVFPQLRGLGTSRLAEYFGLAAPREAAEYWDDDVLGERLRSAVEVLLGLGSDTEVEQVFGKVDSLKLRSCMTIFEHVSYQDDGIVEVLARYFGNERCPRTLKIIEESAPARRMRISR